MENKYISIKYIKISIFKKERREDGEREGWKNYPYDNLRCISESLSSEMKNPVTRSIRLCTLESKRVCEKIRDTRETIAASRREQSYPWKRVS